MTISGIMIYDNSGDPLEKKVQRAVARYRERYGSEPTVCKVNNQLVTEATQVAGVMVIPAREIEPDKYLIGVEN